MAQVNPRVFFDVEVGGLPMGRIIFELYADICPDTCENFRALCTGDNGLGKTTGKPLHYKGIVFHRVVKDFMIQGGDFSVGNGTGGESIYGGTFPDENFNVKHGKPFLLSMANRGKDTNGSQFFITTQPAPHLDNVHVVFGEVVSGQEIVSHIEGLPVDRMSRPLQDAKVVNCGELVLKLKTRAKKREPKEVSSSGSDSDSYSGKAKKKKKIRRSKKKSRSEDGEIQDSNDEENAKAHPLVSVTKIDPDEIPEVPANKFLYRAGPTNNANQKEFRSQHYGRDRMRSNRKTGRMFKGRGVFRYHTPSRSRSRSMTPPHWKQAQNRTIKLHEFQKIEKERMKRDDDYKNRLPEKKRKFVEDPDEAGRIVDGTGGNSVDRIPEELLRREGGNRTLMTSVVGEHGGNYNRGTSQERGNDGAKSVTRNGTNPQDKYETRRRDNGRSAMNRESSRSGQGERWSSRRDSRERAGRRTSGRSRERRRSRDRDGVRRGGSSRDRRNRRNYSPKRRETARNERSTREMSKNRDKRSSVDKKSSNPEIRSSDRSYEKSNDRKDKIAGDSLAEAKFRRSSRSTGSSSRNSKD